jgi:small ligand-binding sensory domain FIST
VRFAAGLSTQTQWQDAVGELVSQVGPRLAGADTDVAFIFAHPDLIPHLAELLAALRDRLQLRHYVGCTGSSVIGRDREIEKRCAVSILAGQAPATTCTPFHVIQEQLEESSGPEFWQFETEAEAAADPGFVLLADPFSLNPDLLVRELNQAYPAAPMVGGLASGATEPAQNRLFFDGEIVTEGALGLAISGRTKLHTLVSQGCRPIGEPLVVTRAERNILRELGGRPPLRVLQELLPQLPPTDRQLAQHGLLIGRVVNEYKEEFTPGDFLIRSLIGQDPQSGALAIGDRIRTGQTLQFQVRDGQAAGDELQALLAATSTRLHDSPPQGALLFSCLGRGENMFGRPHHDIGALQAVFGPVPTAGFFCNGEIGPVGDQTFLHGFSSVVGFFSEAPPPA